jgi:hypothetical protein
VILVVGKDRRFENGDKIYINPTIGKVLNAQFGHSHGYEHFIEIVSGVPVKFSIQQWEYLIFLEDERFEDMFSNDGSKYLGIRCDTKNIPWRYQGVVAVAREIKFGEKVEQGDYVEEAKGLVWVHKKSPQHILDIGKPAYSRPIDSNSRAVRECMKPVKRGETSAGNRVPNFDYTVKRKSVNKKVDSMSVWDELLSE